MYIYNNIYITAVLGSGKNGGIGKTLVKGVTFNLEKTVWKWAARRFRGECGRF